jgi:hypothetical protein
MLTRRLYTCAVASSVLDGVGSEVVLLSRKVRVVL